MLLPIVDPREARLFSQFRDKAGARETAKRREKLKRRICKEGNEELLEEGYEARNAKCHALASECCLIRSGQASGIYFWLWPPRSDKIVTLNPVRATGINDFEAGELGKVFVRRSDPPDSVFAHER